MSTTWFDGDITAAASGSSRGPKAQRAYLKTSSSISGALTLGELERCGRPRPGGTVELSKRLPITAVSSPKF